MLSSKTWVSAIAVAIDASEGEQELIELIKINPPIKVTILIQFILLSKAVVLDIMTQPLFFMFLTHLTRNWMISQWETSLPG